MDSTIEEARQRMLQEQENRWRDHVADDVLTYVDLILAEEECRPSEAMLAREIIRLGRELDDQIEAASWAGYGEDL
jgi:hypothetical protein